MNSEPLTPTEQKQFSSWKFDLINGLMLDARIKGNAFKVGVGIIQHINNRSLTAWPSMDVLAAELNISRTTVKGGIAKLEECGWLTIEKKRGNTSNTYTMDASQIDDLKDARDMRVSIAREKSAIRSIESYQRQQREKQGRIVGQKLNHTKPSCGPNFDPSMGQFTHSTWVNSCTETPSLELPNRTPSIMQGEENNTNGEISTVANATPVQKHIRSRLAKTGCGFQAIKAAEQVAANNGFNFIEADVYMDSLDYVEPLLNETHIPVDASKINGAIQSVAHCTKALKDGSAT